MRFIDHTILICTLCITKAERFFVTSICGYGFMKREKKYIAETVTSRSITHLR